MRVLLAPGGLGKSFVVGTLRQQLQFRNVRELLMDGETIDSDATLVSQTFSALFPLPRTAFEAALRPALQRWLETLGLPSELRDTVADDLCGTGGLRADAYSPGLRANLLAVMLAEASASRGLVFIFEDLHKVAPSVLSLLADTLGHLRATGRGTIFFLLTSRPATEGHNMAGDWLARLHEVSSIGEQGPVHLPPVAHHEAVELLRATVPTLSDAQADRIVSQVGTSPFNLREAVLYLRQLEVLRDLGPGSPTVLIRPTELNKLLDHDGLRTSTLDRLKVFFRDQPVWLRRMVEAGACYGRQFSRAATARAASVADPDQCFEALDDCARWSIVVPTAERRGYLEFDHDLVRAGVLAQLPKLRQQELADHLLSEMAEDESPYLRASLAYQAGRADRAFQYAQIAAAGGRARGRPADALKANYLALLMVDPAWARFAQSGDEWVDIAVQVALPTRLSFEGWQERDREALSILLDNLYSLGTISSGSSRLSDALLSEARMVAERLGDAGTTGALMALAGRMLFERDDAARALEHHVAAEQVFDRLGLERSAERAENLVRMAVCLRQLGRGEDSAESLRAALKHCPKANWTLLNKVRSNSGALYLKSDWAKVRYHWERQLRSARTHKLLARQAHALASLSFINLFDGRMDEGRRQAEEGLRIAREQGLDNTILRCDLNLSVAFLRDGNANAALQCLNEAEAIALRHNIGRRLWRVYANFATTWEVLCEPDKALASDAQALSSLNAATWEPDTLHRRGRALLPLLNIAGRAGAAPQAYAPLLDQLSDAGRNLICQWAAALDTGTAIPLPAILLKYRVQLGRHHRFLVTE